MAGLALLESLLEADRGIEIPLPPALSTNYGALRFPLHEGRPHVVGNFVTTLDGVASLGDPRLLGGGPISGGNPHDRMVMGLLRSVADAVIVGAGTLRSVPRHLWNADYIFPPLSDAYRELRAALGKAEPPLNVIVTSRGEIDPALPVFSSGAVPVLIVTTPEGVRRLRTLDLPSAVGIAEVEGGGAIGAGAILAAAGRARPGSL